mmetsp:Transcript_47656/g.111540  ORF Transcript_47656/g.111540 Transcript_47656/m.111540 type:complete len:474 (+) Transcript_47656:466-1887(+)
MLCVLVLFVLVRHLLVEPLIPSLQLESALLRTLRRVAVASVSHHPGIECKVRREVTLVQLQLVIKREAVLMTEEPKDSPVFQHLVQLLGRAQVHALEVAVRLMVGHQHDAAFVIRIIQAHSLAQPFHDFIRLGGIRLIGKVAGSVCVVNKPITQVARIEGNEAPAITLPCAVARALSGVLVPCIDQTVHAIDGFVVPSHEETGHRTFGPKDAMLSTCGRLRSAAHDVPLEIFQVPHGVGVSKVESHVRPFLGQHTAHNIRFTGTTCPVRRTTDNDAFRSAAHMRLAQRGARDQVKNTCQVACVVLVGDIRIDQTRVLGNFLVLGFPLVTQLSDVVAHGRWTAGAPADLLRAYRRSEAAFIHHVVTVAGHLRAASMARAPAAVLPVLQVVAAVPALFLHTLFAAAQQGVTLCCVRLQESRLRRLAIFLVTVCSKAKRRPHEHQQSQELPNHTAEMSAGAWGWKLVASSNLHQNC